MAKKHNKIQRILSQCEKIQRCTECNKLLNRYEAKKHKCNEFHCSICKYSTLKENHVCYIQPDVKKSNVEDRKQFIFFDIETEQFSETAKKILQIPNCIVAEKVCDRCKNTDENDCKYCGKKEYIFLGSNSLTEFGDWLFSGENYGCTVLAHNFKSFDGQFILNYLHENQAIKPEIITRGLEILLLKAGGLRFIDTLNYINNRLSELPKIFGIENSKKGTFPFLFNTRENFDYIGSIPAKEFYGIDRMKEK